MKAPNPTTKPSEPEIENPDTVFVFCAEADKKSADDKITAGERYIAYIYCIHKP